MQEPAEQLQARYVSFWIFLGKVKLRYTIIYPDSNASRSKNGNALKIEGGAF
jgi:hypothetical protein